MTLPLRRYTFASTTRRLGVAMLTDRHPYPPARPTRHEPPAPVLPPLSFCPYPPAPQAHLIQAMARHDLLQQRQQLGRPTARSTCCGPGCCLMWSTASCGWPGGATTGGGMTMTGCFIQAAAVPPELITAKKVLATTTLVEIWLRRSKITDGVGAEPPVGPRRSVSGGAAAGLYFQ